MQIAGKVIVVTGGASGIGRGLSERFVRDGAAALIVADLDFDKAREAADAIGGPASAIGCNVPSQNVWPTTAACCTTVRSTASSESMTPLPIPRAGTLMTRRRLTSSCGLRTRRRYARASLISFRS